MVTLYHVTPIENLEIILSEGLVPIYGSRSQYDQHNIEGIFFNKKLRQSIEMGQNFLVRFPVEDLALLEVEVNQQTYRDPVHETYDRTTSVYVLDPIPPEDIKVIIPSLKNYIESKQLRGRKQFVRNLEEQVGNIPFRPYKLWVDLIQAERDLESGKLSDDVFELLELIISSFWFKKDLGFLFSDAVSVVSSMTDMPKSRIVSFTQKLVDAGYLMKIQRI